MFSDNTSRYGDPIAFSALPQGKEFATFTPEAGEVKYGKITDPGPDGNASKLENHKLTTIEPATQVWLLVVKMVPA